jgi:hypothetical protein
MFVQTDSSIIIGGAFSPVSSIGGPQYDIPLMFYRDQGRNHDWWLKYNDTWVGYYPNSYYDSSGIADKGAEIDYGGEIVDDNVVGVHTTTDMGSGRFPSEGWQYSAYIRHIVYVDMTNVSRNASNLTASASNTNYYDLSLLLSGDANWVNHMFFGGPGGTSATAKADFNKDSNSDIIWQNRDTGERYLWLMNGTQVSVGVNLGTVQPTTWDVVGTGDFNRDGNVDILWQNRNTGERYLWLMNGTQYSSGVSLGTVLPTTWDIVGTGDFNRDGNVDIVWQNRSTGERYLWLMNGTQYSSGVNLGTVQPTTWDIVGTGDFNRDGNVDILWQNRSTGERYLWLMNGTQYSSGVNLGTVQPTTWDIVGAGDFNRDGNVDILWQNRSSGERYVWLMNGTQYSSGVNLGTVLPTTWDIRNR